MKNYVKAAANIGITAPYARLSGEPVQVGAALFGVCQGDIGNGATGEIVTEGVFDLVKLAGTAWNVGDKIYWDNTAKNCTLVTTSNLYIGICTKAALSADVVGRVRLNGSY